MKKIRKLLEIWKVRAGYVASGGPGSAKNDPKSAKVSRKCPKWQKWSKLAKKNRIAAKPSSQRWSKFWKENHQKLAFREGVQPWDLASCSGRIESYRFIMESSKSKPYSASYDFPSWQWLSAPPGMLAVAVSTHRGGGPMVIRGHILILLPEKTCYSLRKPSYDRVRKA